MSCAAGVVAVTRPRGVTRLGVGRHHPHRPQRDAEVLQSVLRICGLAALLAFLLDGVEVQHRLLEDVDGLGEARCGYKSFSLPNDEEFVIMPEILNACEMFHRENVITRLSSKTFTMNQHLQTNQHLKNRLSV